MKSQVLAGGRGLGKFKNGFQGGVHIVKTEDAEGVAEKMLGQTLVTKQTGEGGKPVNTLYVASKLDLVNEMYFAILLDRATAGPMLIGCSEGTPPPPPHTRVVKAPLTGAASNYNQFPPTLLDDDLRRRSGHRAEPASLYGDWLKPKR